MTDILSRRLIPSPDAVESAVGNETVILHLVNGTYYGLDPIGTRIWALLKEAVSNSDICHAMAEEYDVELATIEDDARLFLAELETHGIVVDA